MMDRRKSTKGHTPEKGAMRRANESYCFALFDELPREDGQSQLDQKLATRKSKNQSVADALSKATKNDRGES